MEQDLLHAGEARTRETPRGCRTSVPGSGDRSPPSRQPKRGSPSRRTPAAVRRWRTAARRRIAAAAQSAEVLLSQASAQRAPAARSPARSRFPQDEDQRADLERNRQRVSVDRGRGQQARVGHEQHAAQSERQRQRAALLAKREEDERDQDGEHEVSEELPRHELLARSQCEAAAGGDLQRHPARATVDAVFHEGWVAGSRLPRIARAPSRHRPRGRSGIGRSRARPRSAPRTAGRGR